MDTVDPPEIQKVTYNKDYSLDLSDFDPLDLNFGADADTAAAAKTLFEKTLLCKIYGIEYTLEKDSSNVVTNIQIPYYYKFDYKIMYAVGDDDGDTRKCLFGIVSNFKATGNIGVPSPYNSNARVDITSLDIEKPYFFILAHRNATTGDNAVPAKDILRVHEIVTCPNTHFVSVEEANSTNCGLFGGPIGETSCIFGFFKTKEKSADTVEKQFFYLPSNSYCLQGRTKDIIKTINEGEAPGRFKVSTLYSNIVTSA